jgi:WD40 repeat protein
MKTVSPRVVCVVGLALAGPMACKSGSASDRMDLRSKDAANTIATREPPLEPGAPAILAAAPRANSATPVPSTKAVEATPAGDSTFAEKHEKGVLSVAFVPPDGERALSSGVDDVARLWDTRSGQIIQRFSGKAFRFQSVALAKDGSRALTSGKPGATYWELSSGNVLKTLTGQRLGVRNVALAPGENSAATAGFDGSIIVWDLDTGQERRRIADAGPVLSVGFSENGAQIRWVGDDNRACRAEVEGSAAPACAPLDGCRLDVADVRARTSVAGCRDGALVLWDSESGRKRKNWSAHKQAVTSVYWLADSGLAVSTGTDHAVRVWNAEKGKLVAERTGLTGFDTVAALSPDGGRVLYATGDGNIHLFSLPPSGR